MATITYQGLEVLYTRQQIAERVAEMGAQITNDLNGEKLVMVGVLKGAAPFLADLARNVQVDATFDFVAVSSYGKGQRSSAPLTLRALPDNDTRSDMPRAARAANTGLRSRRLRAMGGRGNAGVDLHLLTSLSTRRRDG